MIDRTHDLPVARQCQVLSLARSTAYYRPQESSEADLALMRRIDELHLEHLPAAACCATCSNGKAIRSAASMWLR
jgi:putative transposase